MIIWLNGTFGVGKTTTADLLKNRVTNCRSFDPEHVGYLLNSFFRDEDVADFQDLPPWRTLVPYALRTLHTFTRSHLVAPQTVLVQEYWTELREGIESSGIPLTHVVLDATEESIRTRITDDEDQDPAIWRLDHVTKYIDARPWMAEAADVLVDTTHLTPAKVVDAIVDAIEW